MYVCTELQATCGSEAIGYATYVDLPVHTVTYVVDLDLHVLNLRVAASNSRCYLYTSNDTLGSSTSFFYRPIHSYDLLAVKMLAQQVFGNLLLPLVAVRQQLLLVIQELLVRFGGELEVGSLHDGIDGTGLLAVSAIDALGHVDVVPGSPTGPILSLLGIDGDSLGGTGRLAELTGDAPLVSGGVPAQSVLSAESGTEVSLLEGVIDGHLGFHGGLEAEDETSPDLRHEENFRRPLEDVVP
jgi:hypothetical protein